jgi:NAD-dependent dihydropyrimidine dehydrogenase PreA subunit
VDVCPEYCLAFVPLEDVELPDDERDAVMARAEGRGLPLTALLKDDDRCIRCGLCAIRCPTGAMTMERFSITERWAAPAAAGSGTPDASHVTEGQGSAS